MRASSHVKIIHIESNTYVYYTEYLYMYELVCIRTYVCTLFSRERQKNTQQNDKKKITIYFCFFILPALYVFDNYILAISLKKHSKYRSILVSCHAHRVRSKDFCFILFLPQFPLLFFYSHLWTSYRCLLYCIGFFIK